MPAEFQDFFFAGRTAGQELPQFRRDRAARGDDVLQILPLQFDEASDLFALGRV